ncbi:MAG: amidohydrolase, partial [Spirochaetia bacterium]|nr:amidohydrolase [Spirochaetia bacterium]
MKHTFFDSHMHAMNMMHPSFSSFVDSVSEGFTDFVASGALSPGYLLTPAMRGQQGMTTLLNMFSIFERPIGEIFATIEEDLLGSFISHQRITTKKESPHIIYPKEPYIRDSKFHFRNKVYDNYALIPLVMDFSSKGDDTNSKSYYTPEEQEKILTYIQDTIEGIKWYKEIKKNGLLEFYPFLGINPSMHTHSFIENLINEHVRLPKEKKAKSEKLFRGIKFYPPLGTNPWPEKGIERDKISYIYKFCEDNRVPIITHCDDQGFRGINSKIAQRYSDPLTY